MEEPLVNRVQESGLIQLDLERELAPPKVANVDLSAWLEGGFVLREKHFRQEVKAWDATPYQDHVVAMDCSTDAILPDWAWMLVAQKLSTVEAMAIHGPLERAQTEAWKVAVERLDVERFREERLIVKGCASAGGPGTLVAFTQKVSPIVKSLMFGEACSAVPIVKNRTL